VLHRPVELAAQSGHSSFRGIAPAANGCQIIGKYAGLRRQIASAVFHRAGQFADRLRAFGVAVEIAHGCTSDQFLAGAPAAETLVVKQHQNWVVVSFE